MSAHTVPVYIFWSEFKYRNVPTSGKYITVANFLGHPESGSWSVVLENIEPRIGYEAQSKGTARFLADSAPSHLLAPGAVFEMLEGNKISARIEVI